MSSAWAQVNIKDQFLTPKNVDPGQTGVGSSLVCHFEEKQDKKRQRTHKYLGELHMGPRENVNNQHCQFRSDQRYQDHINLRQF